MKDKVVDFETEYFLKKQKEAHAAFDKNDFNSTLNIIAEPIKKIEELNEAEIYCPQNVFDAAVFLNYLGKPVKQTSFSKINYYDFYMMEGSSLFNLDYKKEAREHFRKAIKFNPCGISARILDLLISIEINDYENFIENVQDALFFVYDRENMSLIYKLTGDYLLHIGDHELGIVAYHLSLLYKLDNTVSNLIKTVGTELNIDLDSQDWLSETYLKKFHNTYKIPIMPNEKLITLAKAMGKEAQIKKSYKVSLFTYKIAYELTYDENILKTIEYIENLIKQ